LEKASAEERNYREFLRLSKELVEVNEKICDLRPARVIEGEQELDELKKKLRRQYSGRLRRK
jgi:hypothetical protein